MKQLLIMLIVSWIIDRLNVSINVFQITLWCSESLHSWGIKRIRESWDNKSQHSRRRARVNHSRSAWERNSNLSVLFLQVVMAIRECSECVAVPGSAAQVSLERFTHASKDLWSMNHFLYAPPTSFISSCQNTLEMLD